MTVTVNEEADMLFEYDEILKAAKKYFENIDSRDINFLSVSRCIVEIGLGKYIKYHFVEKLAFRLRQDLWNWKDAL